MQSSSHHGHPISSVHSRMASSDSWSTIKNLPNMLMTRASFKVNEDHLLSLAIKARLENRECGYLSRRGGQDPSSSPNKWQLKWFVLYQNLLFYYDNVNSTKPQGVYFLESCYSTRSTTKNSKDGEKLVSEMKKLRSTLWLISASHRIIQSVKYFSIGISVGICQFKSWIACSDRRTARHVSFRLNTVCPVIIVE